MSKVYLIDSAGFFYRAYYALPEMNAGDEDQNINAVYGFFRMFFKLLKKQPDYVGIVGDSPKKTLRHQDFDEYKANRPKTPDNLKYQMKLIKDIIKNLGLPFFQIPGYEADDIIASMAQHLSDKYEDMDVYIISSDKDLKQIVTDKIIFWDTFDNKRIDRTKFIENYGFEPKYLLDYLALKWDSSDNIPWAKWIGPKTASKLIKSSGQIDDIYANIDQLDISDGMKTKLINDKEQVYFSKKLVDLYEVPGIESIDLADVTIDLDFQILKDTLLEKYNFKSFKKSICHLEQLYDRGTQESLF